MFSTLTPQAILFFSFCGAALFILTRYIPEIRAFYHNRVKWNTEISQQDYHRYDTILSARLPYYRKLSIAGKARFIHRLIATMAEKEFAGRNKLTVTEEMRVVVCGAIVQITFGMKKYSLTHFDRILLYPERFYNSLLETHLKGGTSPGGVVMLSWEDVIEGFTDENDNYNLALHEMAHALKLDVTEGDDFDHRFSSYLDQWEEIGENVMHRMRQFDDVMLRKYAKTNLHEFFAVSVENFFETPQKLKQNLPDIYNHLCILLNQDPTNAAEDYELPLNFAQNCNNDPGIIPVPTRVSVNFNYRMWYWTYNVIILGIVVMIPIGTYASNTIVGGFGWKGIYVCAFLTCFAAQGGLLYKRDMLSISHLFLYTLLGTAPLLMFGFYLVNSSSKIHDQEEKYKPEQYISDNEKRVAIYELKNNTPSGKEKIGKTLKLFDELDEIPFYYVVDYDCGILGYRIEKSKKLVIDENMINVSALPN